MLSRNQAAAVLALLACAALAFAGDVSIEIDTMARHQTIQGFGAACRFVDKPYTHVYRDESFQKLITDELGLTILRFELSPGLLSVKPVEITPETLDPTAMDVPAKFAQALKLRIGDDFKLIASIWSPPAWMKSNGKTTDGGSLRPECMEDFAAYCVAAVQLLKSRYGLELHALSIQNEPYFSQSYDSCVYTPQQFSETAAAVKAELTRSGLGTRLMGPEDVGPKFPERFLQYADGGEKYFDFFCIHGADGSGVRVRDRKVEEPGLIASWFSPCPPQALSPALSWVAVGGGLARYKKPLWVTESSGESPDWDGALQAARRVHEAVVHGGSEAWLYWQLNLPGRKAREALCVDGAPTPKFYALRHFFRYVRPGAVRIGVADIDGADVLASAFENPGGDGTTVVVINLGEARYDARLFVDGKLERPAHGWASTESAHAQPLIPGSGTFPIPPKSIVTLKSM